MAAFGNGGWPGGPGLAIGHSSIWQLVGIGVALGAPPGAVSQTVLGQGLRLTAVLLVIGLAGAAFATRALTTMLIGVNSLDPMTFGAITVLPLATTLLAAYVPTRRALRVDPTAALRAE